jgi:hypothetical protein
MTMKLTKEERQAVNNIKKLLRKMDIERDQLGDKVFELRRVITTWSKNSGVKYYAATS